MKLNNEEDKRYFINAYLADVMDFYGLSEAKAKHLIENTLYKNVIGLQALEYENALLRAKLEEHHTAIEQCMDNVTNSFSEFRSRDIWT